jgi:hypothetical protein
VPQGPLRGPLWWHTGRSTNRDSPQTAHATDSNGMEMSGMIRRLECVYVWAQTHHLHQIRNSQFHSTIAQRLSKTSSLSIVTSLTSRSIRHGNHASWSRTGTARDGWLVRCIEYHRNYLTMLYSDMYCQEFWTRRLHCPRRLGTPYFPVSNVICTKANKTQDSFHLVQHLRYVGRS